MDLWATLAAVAIATLLIVIATEAQAQTFVTLHNFSGSEGEGPMAGLTMDGAGNLYGTAAGGSNTSCPLEGGCGTVFKLTHKNGSWILNTLYAFSGPDGANPASRVLFGPDGDLYGTTMYGGAANQGTVFKLSPPPNACVTALCPWRETVLHSFGSGNDGQQPQYGDLAFDRQGNIYGTTPYGGNAGCDGAGSCGVIYELTPSNGSWMETILYRFQGVGDGGIPFAGMIFDNAGNLYGTANTGGTEYGGVVFELSPSEGGWAETVLYNFDVLTTGQFPTGGLLADHSGNLYGATSESGIGTAGTAYELTPSNGSWTATALFGLSGYTGTLATLTMDTAGNLYGTLFLADNEVFKLTPSNGKWTQTGFSGSDGGYPSGNVIFDASGNLYTTAFTGGKYGKGVVFEITP